MRSAANAPKIGTHGFFDIGSNSVVCLVVEVVGDEAEILYDKSLISKLGSGLGPEGLHPDSARRTFEAIDTHLLQVSALGVAPHYTGVATSAMRDAADGGAFVRRLRRDLGLEIEIISGEREAELTWQAVNMSFPELGPAVVLDIGGGSTEIIRGTGNTLTDRVSLDIGSVRLTGRCIQGDPPTSKSMEHLRREIGAALGSAPEGTSGRAGVGSGSTVTTLMALAAGVEPYDPTQIHGQRLTRRQVTQAVNTLSKLTIEERGATPGIDPGRAEVIVAGATILDEAMAWAGLEEIIVCDRGLRFGVLAEALPGVRLL